MIRLAGSSDPLLGRPMAVYDTRLRSDGCPAGVDVVYLAVGKMTRLLTSLAVGERLEVWGPLGNGFAPLPTAHLVMVAGGIGQTPFLSLCRSISADGATATRRARFPAARVTLCYGTRSSEFLVGVHDFRRAGVEVHLSTEDGTVGRKGLVTDLVPAVVARVPPLPHRVLWARGDDDGHRPAGPAAWRCLRGVAGDAHELRDRDLL